MCILGLQSTVTVQSGTVTTTVTSLTIACILQHAEKMKGKNVCFSMTDDPLKYKYQSSVGIIYWHTETVTHIHIPNHPIVTAWLSAPRIMPAQYPSRKTAIL